MHILQYFAYYLYNICFVIYFLIEYFGWTNKIIHFE